MVSLPVSLGTPLTAPCDSGKGVQFFALGRGLDLWGHNRIAREEQE